MGKYNYQWFDSQTISYDNVSSLYGVFFPCDGKTIFINPSQEEDDIMSKTFRQHCTVQ